MLDDLDLDEVVAVVEEALGAFRETEAVPGGEEREEQAVALWRWLKVIMEEGGETGGGGGRGGSGSLLIREVGDDGWRGRWELRSLLVVGVITQHGKCFREGEGEVEGAGRCAQRAGLPYHKHHQHVRHGRVTPWTIMDLRARCLPAIPNTSKGGPCGDDGFGDDA